MKRQLILAIYLVIGLSLFSQEIKYLTLDDCVNRALQRSISIKQASNNVIISKSNSKQAIAELMPEVNGSVNYGYFFGTTFDVNAARQVSATTRSSGPALNATLNLFNGLTNYHNIQKRKSEIIAAREDLKVAEFVTEIEVIESFLNVAVSRESIKIATKRLELLQKQLDREIKRESIGVGNLESVYNFKSQVASEKFKLQNLQNNYQKNNLKLMQTIQINPLEYEVRIDLATLRFDNLLEEPVPFEEALNKMILVNHNIKRAEATKKAKDYEVKSTFGNSLPSIIFRGVYGSNYSSNGAINPNVDPGASGLENFESDATFWEQIGYNEYQYADIAVNIPVFNRYRNGNRHQTAKLEALNAQLDYDLVINNVTNNLQNVYYELIAAQNSFQTVSSNLESVSQAFEFMKIRYEMGSTDFYTYLESLNNKNKAEIDLINAKYTILLRKKIFELYVI